jgi:hypothetical protein
MDLTYTEDLTELNPARLAQFDGLVIYANQTAISSEQEKALIEYVEGGKGLIPLTAPRTASSTPRATSISSALNSCGTAPECSAPRSLSRKTPS